MATLEEIRAIDTLTVKDQYHDDPTGKGYKHSRHGRSVAIERAGENDFSFIPDRMITPFTDVSHEFDVFGDPTSDEAIGSEWNRRRRMLGKEIDSWIDNINLPKDRLDGFRCWTDSDTPHLIVRYGEKFHEAITGTNRIPLLKYIAIAKARSHDLVVLGNVLMADNIDDLARLCVVRGLGIKEPAANPEMYGWLLYELDSGALGVNNRRLLERTIQHSYQGH